MNPIHLPAVRVLLAAGLMLATAGLSAGDPAVAEPVDPAVARLWETFDGIFDRWDGPGKPPGGYQAEVRKVLGSLSGEEIRLTALNLDGEVGEEAFRMWARSDPAAALKAVRKEEDANAEEIKLAGTSLEGGPGEGISQHIFGRYLAAIQGWAETDARAAWKSFRDREGPLSGSRVIESYFSSFHPVLLEHLAKADPDLAFAEIARHAADGRNELVNAAMLRGYLAAAPHGRPWRAEAERLLGHAWRNSGPMHEEIRISLMGRWLEDDAAAAEKWFDESDAEGIGWSRQQQHPFSEPADGGVKVPHDLAGAAGYWAARDLPAAWAWMKSRGMPGRDGYGREMVRGAERFLVRETSRFPEPTVRNLLRKKAAGLPAADRGAWESMLRRPAGDDWPALEPLKIER